MRLVLLFFVLLCGQRAIAQNAPALNVSRPVEPVTTIIDAFRTHRIVALGNVEFRGNEQSHTFQLTLIRDPRFSGGPKVLISRRSGTALAGARTEKKSSPARPTAVDVRADYDRPRVSPGVPERMFAIDRLWEVPREGESFSCQRARSARCVAVHRHTQLAIRVKALKNEEPAHRCLLVGSSIRP